jgi:hypothetical protein
MADLPMSGILSAPLDSAFGVIAEQVIGGLGPNMQAVVDTIRPANLGDRTPHSHNPADVCRTRGQWSLRCAAGFRLRATRQFPGPRIPWDRPPPCRSACRSC